MNHTSNAADAAAWPVWRILAVVTGLIAAAAVLRLWGLEMRTLSHPEIYIPGIPLPPGISEPPPRQTLAEALWWHFHDEPHPIGWYLAMFGWTEAFGTAQATLRLPGVIQGALSVGVIFLVAKRVFGLHVAVLAALLLTLHGFHLYWSQTARMYVSGTLLSLLASWLLLQITSSRHRRPALEAGYVLVLVAGVQTVELFWPLIFLHIFWAALVLPPVAPVVGIARLWNAAPRLIQIQSVALMLAAPALSHAVYRARKGAAPDPSAQFLTEYFGFGFLFARDAEALPVLSIGAPWQMLLAAAGIFCLVLSLRATSNAPVAVGAGRPVSILLRMGVALAAVALMLWMASIAHRRSLEMAVMAVLPLLVLALPALVGGARWLILRPLSGLVARLRADVVLLWLLAVLPPLVLYLVSFVVSVLAPRAFLVFVPYLLILISAGALNVVRRGSFRLVASGALAVVFAASLPYVAHKPGNPNDYKALARQMIPLMQSGDLVLVRDRDWVDTPFLYYLPDARLVATDYDDALAAEPAARAWVVTWPYEGAPTILDDRHKALADYKPIVSLSALRASAMLYQR